MHETKMEQVPMMHLGEGERKIVLVSPNDVTREIYDKKKFLCMLGDHNGQKGI